MQPNGMIFWDWNGTLMDDVDFTHSCLNWMLETHGYPQRYDLAAYRELFGFPIEDYYRCAGFDFARHPRFFNIPQVFCQVICIIS